MFYGVQFILLHLVTLRAICTRRKVGAIVPGQKSGVDPLAPLLRRQQLPYAW